MGHLVDGIWRDEWYDTKSTGGRFVRKDSAFRNWIGEPDFPAEAGRYHLYVSLACPWAHRTLIFRKLKGLEEVISVSVVDAHMGEQGWTLSEGADPINSISKLFEIYQLADNKYNGRVTVPVLWDKKTRQIVNNESSEIIRMFGSAFEPFAKPGDYYPKALRQEIDAINATIYDEVNNGVYKAGFATEQSVYKDAVTTLFAALDRLEAHLSKHRYLVGDQITEADWRLFTTLLRFDPVYVGHFKCNIRRLADYPNLWAYTRELYQVPGVAETVDMDHIKGHYYGSHKTINPSGIIPTGPAIDFHEPHGRECLS